MSALELCRSSLAALIREHWLPEYSRSGRFKPAGRSRPGVPKELEKLLWYARLEGPLYADANAWRAAYRLVDSFRQGQPARLHSHLILDHAFVLAATPLQDLHGFL